MAYFIHNKYDKDSIAKVTLQSDGSYLYNDDNSIIVIDYYGLLESGDTTYKSVDTSKMGSEIINDIAYASIGTSFNGDVDVTDGLSNNSVKTALFDMCMDLVGKVGSSSDTGTNTLMGLGSHIINKMDDEQKIYTPSNNVLKTIISSETSVWKGTAEIYNTPIYITRDGTLRLSCSLRTSNRSYASTVLFNIKQKYYDINNSGYTHKTVGVSGWSTDDYSTVTSDIDVHKGDIITSITLSSSYNYGSYCKLVTICGTVVDPPNKI